MIHHLEIQYCKQETLTNVVLLPGQCDRQWLNIKTTPCAENMLGHCVLFLCFISEKIQNLMREGGKNKHFRKKNSTYFWKR